MKKLQQRPSRSRRLAFEALEPRALLSADLLPVATLPDAGAPIAAEFREYVATDTSPVVLLAAESPRELVIIDSAVANPGQLAGTWRDRGFDVAVLDPAQDAIAQIGDLLAARSGLSAVHLVTHGVDGALQLGGTSFDASTLSTRSVEVARWSHAFAETGDLLLYGCDVAGDAWGGAFVERLALLTGADVAASTDDTGAALLGGDWHLEYATGAIESATLDAADWLHLLAPQTITWSAVTWPNGDPAKLGPVNIAIGTLGDVVVTLTGDTAQLQNSSPGVTTNLQGGFGGSAGSSLSLDSNGGFAFAQSVDVLFDFSALPGEVVNLSFYVFDIDVSGGGGGFIDRVTITANGGALNPTTLTASGINNFSDGINTITGQTANSTNPSGDGNAFFQFGQQGITSFTLNYGNANTTGQSTQGIGVNTITFYIAPKNAVPATVTTAENTSFAFSGGNALSVSDDDATSVTLAVANGTLALTASGGATLGGAGGTRTITGTLASINATLASLVYTPTAAFNGTDTLTFTSSDGTYSDVDTVDISVTPVNDAPILGSLAGDARGYAAGAGAVLVDQGGNATVTDIDSADFNGGTLTVAIVSGGVPAEDALGISIGSVTLSSGMTVGSTVSVGGTAIGTLTATGSGGANLAVALNASATPSRVETLIRSITYQDTNAVNPVPGARNIRFTVDDGDGATSAAADATITVKPVVGIAATDATAAEPANNGRFTVTLSAASASDTVVSYSIGGTAANGSDYAVLSGSVTILAGATAAVIDVTTTDDLVVEPGETVVLTLTGITAGDSDIRVRTDANSATVNLVDDDTAQVSVTATTAAAEPGSNGVLTVSMTRASSTDTVIAYSIAGTAASGSDYSALSGSVTLLAGSTSATIAVPVLDDTLVEANETVIVTLTGITSGDADIAINGAANSATVAIADDDTAQVSIAATTAAAAEGGANGVFTVSLTNASSTATTVSYTVAGTATSGSDFTALSGSVTIAAGATTATITVPVTDDLPVEGSETVIVTLGAVTAGDPEISINGAANSATVTIADNDSALVSIAATSAAAAEGGANGVFTVSLTNASATATTISYTATGTAVSGSDFTALTGTVTIAAGATTATITVPVSDDALVEASETVVVTLGAVTVGDPDISINGAANSATVTIADNDSALVSIAATTAAAAEGGANGVFTVSMSAASSTDTTVSYTVAGTATSGSDFTALSGTITIAAGATTATITVPVTGDFLVEGSETVVVTCGAVTAGDPDISINGAANAATVTIADNDSAQVSIAATTAAAAEGGANGVFTVSLTNASSTATTVSYAVAGTSASGSDFTALSGTVTIAAGATTATITVPVIDDALVEGSESVIVTLGAVTAGDPDISINGAASSATVAIADNDSALISIAATTAASEPGTGGVFTVSMTQASATDTVVTFTVAGSAIAGTDYVALPVTVTIAAGATSATLAVPVIEDDLVEATETVIVTLTGVTAGDPDIAVDGAANAATVAIADGDNALVSIAATTPGTAEGGANGVFTVSMTQASSTDTVVAYTIAGTAGAGGDYTALTGTVTITAGTTSATISVAAVDDAMVELTETVIVTLTGLTGDPDIAIDGGANAATVNIADNDTALVAIAATDPAAAEPGDGGRYTVSMSAAASTDTVLAYSIAGGAAAGADYAALTGTVTIAAGATSAFIDVTVIDELLVEGDETVVVTLTAITAGDADVAIDGAGNAATVTIADNDTALASVAATTPANEPATTGRFTVSLTQAASTDTVIAYSVAGSAAGGTDYVALTGSVTITAGATTAFIDVATVDDAIVEANETVLVTLLAVTAGDPDIAINGAANTAAVTITDNDTAQVAIAATAPAAEPGTNGQFTVTLSAAASTDTVVAYTIGGTALGGTDYASLSGTVTIAAGATSAVIDVAIVDDALVEATESVVLTLTGITSGDADISINGAANTAAVNLADNDTALVSVAATISGAAESGTNGRFTVTMTNASSTDTVIAYTLGGTAANGVDYVLLPGTVTVLAGATSATIDVAVLGDLIVEADETIVLTLTAVNAGDPDIAIDGAANLATVTVADDDAALVSIAASVPNAAEPGTAGQFTVSTSLAASTDTVVTYTIAGTAAAGADYVALSGTVTILAGATSATIAVPVIDDAIVEGTETVFVTIGAITAGDADIAIDGAASTATVSIADNDSALASIALTSAAAEPGTDGRFTVSLTNVSSTDTVLSYTVAGTAAAGVDYTPLSGTVTIVAGTNSATIDAAVLDDALVELDETVIVTLTAVTSGDPDIAVDGAADTATALLADDDSALLSIAATAPAASEPGTNGRFTVSMTTAASTDTVIAYTIGGTAANGTDYALLSGSVTIAAGSTSAPIDVNVADDLVVEASETVFLTLTSITTGDADIALDGAAAAATVTIADDDAAALTVGDVTVNEAAGTISFGVTVDRAVQGGFTVDAAFGGGTATAGGDYAAATQTLTFAGTAGETQVVTLAIVNDAVVEATETFGVSLLDVAPPTAPAASIAATDTAIGTLLDNDAATITIADVTASEAASALTFAVTIDLAVQGGFSVDAVFTDGTATGGTDYTSAVQTLNFAGTAGETLLVTVPVVDDPLVEADETFTLSLANLVPPTAPVGSIGIADTAIGTIANDDDAPSIADAAAAVLENSLAGTLAIDLADAITLGDADPDGDAISYSIIAGNGAGAFTIDASTGAITVASPLPLDFETTPTFVLTILATDGTNTDTAAITVNLVNANEAPTATVPGAQIIAEDTPLALSTGGGNGIDVADVDAATLQVTLGASNGTLTLSSLLGLAFTAGDGTADAAMTFTGSIAAINAALDGLTYAANANYNGADTISLLLDDQGQSGLGGARTLTTAVPVTVTPVNDGPAIGGDRGLQVAEGGAVAIAGADLAGVDVDDLGAGLVYTVAGAPAHGVLEYAAAPGVALASFTQADLDAGRVRYVHDGSETTADVFTVMLADSGEDGAVPVFATLNVVVTPVNDAPRLVTGGGTVDTGDRLVITTDQVSAIDPDNATDTLVYTVDGTTGGYLELASASGIAITSFTGAQLSAGLVRFVQGDASQAPGFSVSVSDGQATSGPGLVVLTLRATSPLPPQDQSAAPSQLDVMAQTSAVRDPRGADLGVPQSTMFLRVPFTEAGGPVLAEPEPFVPPTPRTRLATNPVLETPSIELASSGLRFDGTTPGEVQIPRLEFSFQAARYDLGGPDEGVPLRSISMDAVQIVGLALTAGGVWWVLRVGSLIGSALVSAPAWRHIDPLPVLGGRERDEVDWDDGDESSEGEEAERYFDQDPAKSPRP